MTRKKLTCLILILITSASVLFFTESVSAALDGMKQPWIHGIIQDAQRQPVKDVDIILFTPSDPNPLACTKTLSDGRFALEVPEPLPDELSIRYDRPHYQQREIKTQFPLRALNRDSIRISHSDGNAVRWCNRYFSHSGHLISPRVLPYLAEHFAAYLSTARVVVGENAFRS